MANKFLVCEYTPVMPGKTQALTQDMSLPNPVEKLSEADYLRLERAAQFKSQFYDGEMFAMSGGTRWHSLITGNLIRELGTALKKQKCLVYDSNMRVKVEATGLYTYPDVVVAGNDQRFLDGVMDTLLNPSLLIEVLSESTEAYDRGKKFIHYRRIPSLNEYLLVSQTEPVVEQFIRTAPDEWTLRLVTGLDAHIELPSLEITLALSEIFSKIDFASGLAVPSARFPSQPT